MTSQLQTRLRNTGTFPPSLLREGVPEPPDGFEDSVVEVLDGNGSGGGLALRSDASAADEFDALLKMTETACPSIAPLSPERLQHVLERRRAILLAIVGATPGSNAALNQILVDGFLVVAKSWLDDILSRTVGGVDLLLHMLSSISSLPVTKDMIATSKLGKAIVSVEKDKICSGSDNEAAIKERVAKVKEEWSQTVKKRKGEADSASSPTSTKRAREASPANSSPAKKAKAEEKKHIMSTSDLLRKSGATNDKSVLGEDGRPLSAAEAARKRAQERHAKEKARIASIGNGTEQKDNQSPPKGMSAPVGSSKKTKHVAFAEKPVIFDAPYAEDAGSDANGEKKDVMSWSDRKKQEHLLEREALAKARKADMTKKDVVGTVVAWKRPETLAIKPDQATVKVVSNEIAVQVARMATVRSARYLSEEDVPNDPTPLSDIEQALEMTSQSSAVQATIPFYVPQQEAPAPAPATTVPLQTPVVASTAQVVPPPPPIVGGNIQGATLEFVTALGLPPFLVGSNVQALQTVATTPGLLQTFVDAQGRYDQTRLMSLVQTLSQSLAPTQQSFVAQPNPVANQATAVNSTMVGSGGFQQHSSAVPPPPPFQQTQQGMYGATPQSSTYGGARSPQNRQQFGKGGGYRGDQNLSEGNLHLSGYGPSTTKEEILALFSPYVQVSEIVPKGSFSFVNTNDPAGARRAREALNGALLGGRPVRINLATRKERDQKPGIKAKMVNRGEVMPLPMNAFGQIDFDQVRDDRGNGATKNLFVAGYGQGTTEQELREIFSQHGQVTGTVMKGSFAFVNTTDRETAVRARQSLTGAVVNGGVLRINFAKESGRLGTSFDQTYNPTSYGPIHQQRVFM